MNRYGARPRQLAAGRGDENRKDGKLAVGTHIRTARRTHLVNSNAARPQAAVAGESISFNHTSRDYFGNLLRRGGEAFSASLTHPRHRPRSRARRSRQGRWRRELRGQLPTCDRRLLSDQGHGRPDMALGWDPDPSTSGMAQSGISVQVGSQSSGIPVKLGSN
jgi:hypothetical protein